MHDNWICSTLGGTSEVRLDQAGVKGTPLNVGVLGLFQDKPDGKDLPTPSSTPTQNRKNRRRSNLFNVSQCCSVSVAVEVSPSKSHSVVISDSQHKPYSLLLEERQKMLTPEVKEPEFRLTLWSVSVLTSGKCWQLNRRRLTALYHAGYKAL